MKEAVMSFVIFAILVLCVISMRECYLITNKKQKVKIYSSRTDSIRMYENNKDTICYPMITFPQNSVTLDYPTDTIYIHDTIYKTKIIIKHKNYDSAFQEPLIREIIEQRDTIRELDVIKNNYKQFKQK